MQASKTDLFTLIKAMTKDEKRYFKNFAKSEGGANLNYIKLFDAIARQREYNEVKIRRKFRGEKFMRQLSVAKNYLYHLLLKSLANFHAKKSAEDEILQGLRYTQILYDKKLAALAQKQIHKIKQTAIEHEFFSYLVKIYLWEFFLERSYLEFQDWEEQSFVQARLRIAECLQLEKDYTNIQIEASAFVFKLKKGGGFRNYKDDLEAILEHSVFQDYAAHPSNKVKIIGLFLQAARQMLNRSYDKAL